MTQRFSVIPAVYLILEREGKILLLKRANTTYMDGWYSLPAGHHDGGESLTTAMCREAREEIGVELVPANVHFAHVMHREKCNDGERVDFYFSCASWAGDVVNCEPEKCSELLWCDPQELPHETIPVVRQAIASWLARVPYSEAEG